MAVKREHTIQNKLKNNYTVYDKQTLYRQAS